MIYAARKQEKNTTENPAVARKKCATVYTVSAAVLFFKVIQGR